MDTIEQIEIDGILIEIVRKPIKNIYVRIYSPDGQVRLSAPLRLSVHHILRQLESKRSWLQTQHARLKATPGAAEPAMESGEYHYYLGQAYRLKLIESHTPPQMTLQNAELYLQAKPTLSTQQKAAVLKRWYQLQMQLLVPILIEKWQPIVGVTVASWGAKTMKTRWGSCNTHSQNITLNLVLMKKPIQCLEYVLVHEMTHLLEPSHNTRFYELMKQFMPDWQTHQKALYQINRFPTEECDVGRNTPARQTDSSL